MFCVLSFRFGVKAWISWRLPEVSRPKHVWGLEDFFFALGYVFDVGHMTMIWKRLAFIRRCSVERLTCISYGSGLGRHFFYLNPLERVQAMKWDFISQPLAVSAAMWSRTGVIVFLYTCFAQNRKQLRVIVIICFVVQIVVNLFTIG